MGNILSNNKMADNFELKVQLEKLTSVGREILENRKMVRVDSRTIKLVKKENNPCDENKNVSKN